MIVEKILDLLMIVPLTLLSTILPMSAEITIPDAVVQGLNGLLGGMGYMLPVVALVPIWALKTSLQLARLVWALIIRIKSFIPMMGA